MIANEVRNNSTSVIHMLDQTIFGHTFHKSLRLIDSEDYLYMNRVRVGLSQCVAKSNSPEIFHDEQPSNDVILKQTV
jgi:hypothetical protein